MDSGAAPGDFAVMLRRLRESRSLTQEELAERSGLTAKAIGALERGERRRPYPHTVRSLADGLALDDSERASLVAAVPRRDAGTRPSIDAPLSAPAGSAGSVSSGPPHAGADGTAGAAGAAGPVGPDDTGGPSEPRNDGEHTASALAGSAVPTAPATPLIGREAEVDRLRALISRGRRLVTITGPGGVGKTRLSLEVLAREASAFPGGAVAVDLAPLRQPALVIPRIAAALGLPEDANADQVDALARHLRGLRVLLVLDNLEQLPGAAPVLADLVARCPDLEVLATSRAPLRVRAEHEVVLSPLATPTDDEVDTVAGSPAVALLLDRAAAAGAPIQATDDDAAALAAITRQLDGLPLALELAAPGLRLLSPTTLLKRLTQTEIGTGPRDLPERHRTMTAVLDWSMDLLEPEEVDLFERLAVFSDGFSLDAVEAVAAPDGADDERADVVPALGTLVEQSLVLRVPSPDDQPRFRLLEPVRQYAMRRLHASGQATATADRHAAHFLACATASMSLLEGPEQVSTLDRLDADHANLRSAYLRLLELDRDGDAAELAGSLWLYLALRGHAREGLEWLEQIGPTASDAARCRGLNGRLGLLLFIGDVEQMRREADAALAVARRVTDPAVTCETLLIVGYAAVFVGDLEGGEELLARGVAQAVDAGRQWIVVQGRFAQAQIALTAGDLTSAGALVPEVVSAARELGNAFSLATSLNLHATVTELVGDEPATAELLGESLALALDGRVNWALAYSLPALGGLALRVGDPASAAWLFGAAAKLTETDAADESFPVSRALSDRGLAATRLALDEQVFTRQWDLGRVATAAEIQAVAAAVTRRAGA